MQQETGGTRIAIPGYSVGMNHEANESPSAPPGPLVICARFMLPTDAEIFAARLNAEGIAAHVMDANLPYSDGFAGGFGTGGIRVMVAASQLDEARRVLAALNAGEYAIDENFDPGPG
jgi:hypothetical protein